jgi:hypothetical protein
MMTVSAVYKLIPRPPALVDSKKQNCSAPSWLKRSIASWPREIYFKLQNVLEVLDRDYLLAYYLLDLKVRSIERRTCQGPGNSVVRHFTRHPKVENSSVAMGLYCKGFLKAPSLQQ